MPWYVIPGQRSMPHSVIPGLRSIPLICHTRSEANATDLSYQVQGQCHQSVMPVQRSLPICCFRSEITTSDLSYQVMDLLCQVIGHHCWSVIPGQRSSPICHAGQRPPPIYHVRSEVSSTDLSYQVRHNGMDLLCQVYMGEVNVIDLLYVYVCMLVCMCIYIYVCISTFSLLFGNKVKSNLIKVYVNGCSPFWLYKIYHLLTRWNSC